MKDRIRLVRKNYKLTQTEFGERIGVKGNTITGYETGLRAPSSAIITAISKEFGISESWLRSGEGDMRVPRTRSEELAGMVSKALNGKPFQKAAIRVICTRTESELDALDKMLKDLYTEILAEEQK